MNSQRDERVGPHHLVLSLSEDPHVIELFESQQIPIDEVVSAVQARKTTRIVNADDRSFEYLSK